ncbi:unnamed protein product, partial [Mycena citricolor]
MLLRLEQPAGIEHRPFTNLNESDAHESPAHQTRLPSALCCRKRSRRQSRGKRCQTYTMAISRETLDESMSSSAGQWVERIAGNL